MATDLGDPYFLEVDGSMTEVLGKADRDLMIASASAAFDRDTRSVVATALPRPSDGGHGKTRERGRHDC
jgi:hypothetical protein